MTEIAATVQIILEEAGYATWLVPVEELVAICFEDDAVMGFVTIFDEPATLLQRWQAVEALLLARHAPRFREAQDKAWNVYSVLLCPKLGSTDETRQIRRIEEDLEKTRKVAACGLAGRQEIVTALLPILPIQYRPRLEGEDLTDRLKKRIAAIAPAVVEVALDEDVAPPEVVRLLGAAP
jgi:hypothetical protein